MKALFLTLLMYTSWAYGARFVVEAVHPLTAQEISLIGHVKLEPFNNKKHDYFSRLYVVSGNITVEKLNSLPFVKLVETAPEIMRLSLLPAKNPVHLVNDELFSYQWGHKNQGQTYLREKDDIHNLPMKGIDGRDIGWDKLFPVLGDERTIVAVLDSGVDLKHPELKNNLWKNDKECGKDPKIDNDDNKLAGDCHGWNFTEAIDSDGAKDPTDHDGHGTHVSGIIAAAMDGRGIVGVAPNALIMPIKVMKDSSSKSDVPSSESFARGIIYAVDNGARVINMSLGWPRSLETKFLREAVGYALSQGVVIVAAAGNNNSSEPLFPCAYEGVVCVAASTLDGTFAGFSNFGGHVDTVAPGEGILSTHPIVFEPDYFSVPGYEIRSGTSQSAPYVAGLISVLVGQKKGMTIDEVFARIYGLQKTSDDFKYVLGGEATWGGLAKEVTGPIIRPILKRVRQILIKGNESTLNIPVRNFGLVSGNFDVKLEVLTPALEVSSPSQKAPGLAQGQAVDLSFNLKVLDFIAESNVKIKITIIEDHSSHSYINEIPVVRDIRNGASFEKLNFIFSEKPLPMGGIKNGEILSFLTTLESYGKTLKHEMYLRRIIKENEKQKLEITLFSREGNNFVQAPKLIAIENALSLVNFIRADLDQDGIEDYLVHTLCEKDKKKYFMFSFYNSKMGPVWKGFQDVVVDLDLFIQSMNEITLTLFKHPKLGEMLVPAFFTEGQIPKIDQAISSWEKLDSSKKKRLYYLEPQDNTFRVRSFTTRTWESSVKQELKSKWYDSVETEQLLPTSFHDAIKGSLRVLVSVGFNSKRKLFIYTFSPQEISHGLTLPQLVLQTETVDPLTSISKEGPLVVGDVFFNVYDRERSKLILTGGENQEGEFVYRHQSETDVIMGHLASFIMGKKQVSILQSRDELISIEKDAQIKISKRPKLRYSFLSQKILAEMYLPVIFERDGVQSPALYVDTTAVTANRISLLELQSGKLVSSIKNSLAVPSNCKAMNPIFTSSAMAHEFVFLCLENNEWNIKTLKMN